MDVKNTRYYQFLDEFIDKVGYKGWAHLGFAFYSHSETGPAIVVPDQKTEPQADAELYKNLKKTSGTFWLMGEEFEIVSAHRGRGEGDWQEWRVLATGKAMAAGFWVSACLRKNRVFVAKFAAKQHQDHHADLYERGVDYLLWH